jgi:hypothetical protein
MQTSIPVVKVGGVDLLCGALLITKQLRPTQINVAYMFASREFHHYMVESRERCLICTSIFTRGC